MCIELLNLSCCSHKENNPMDEAGKLFDVGSSNAKSD